MTTKAPQKGRPGRHPTGHRFISSIRLPKELYARLERRLAKILARTGSSNFSQYLRDAITKKLDADDKDDKAAQREKIRRLRR